MTTAKPSILVTFDGSEVSKSAFGPAARLAKLMQASVVLLRVLRAPPAVWSHPDAAHRDAEMKRLQDDAQRDVDAAAMEMSTFGVEASGRARLLGERWNVTDEILAIADEIDAAMICMATHGEGGIRRLFVGSTSGEVIAKSTRPVTLVRSGTEA
jgi:nucleotide-binding universal stress UspA family protein